MALPVLKGDKITLRQLRRSDAMVLQRNANNREIIRNVTHLPYPYTINHAKSWVEKSLRLARKRKEFHFGIINADSGQLIGMIGLRMVDFKNKNAEVGFWLGKKYWNKGYTTEAVRLIMQYAFNDLRLQRLYAIVLSLNIGSVRVLEKNGLIRECVWRKAHVIGQKRYDVYAYGILKAEFRA